MGIFSGLFRSRDKPTDRTAGSSYAFYLGGSTSGKVVTERSAMQMTAVYACVRILSEAIAGLPLQLYRYKEDGGKEKAIDHPLYLAFGDHEDMQKAIEMLNEVKESIINAYEIKTSLSRAKLSRLMEEETWMNAKKALELGFTDGLLEDAKKAPADVEAYAYSGKAVANALFNKLAEKAKPKKTEPEPAKPEGRSVDDLKARLADIKKFM